MNRPHRQHHGFTLTEALITIGVIGVATALVVPTMRDESRLRLMAAATVVASDLEAAQTMTISNPSNPIVIRFDAPNATYWLAEAATPTIPIVRTDTGQPYVVVLGDGRGMSAEGVDFTTDGLTDATIEFNSAGGLAELMASPSVRFAANDLWIRLDVSSITGVVTESWGDASNAVPEPEPEPPVKTK